MTNLASLPLAPDPLRIAKGTPVEVAIETVLPDGPRFLTVDLSTRQLPADVVASGLNGVAAQHWKALYAALDARVGAQIRRAVAEEALHTCGACAERTCLQGAFAEAEKAAAAAAERMHIEQQALRAPIDHGNPSELVVLAYVTEMIARQDDSPSADFAKTLAPPIAVYGRALDGKPDDRLAGWTLYRLAHALEDSALGHQARDVYKRLAAMSATTPELRALQAEAWLGAGANEDDPKQALADYAQVSRTAPDQALVVVTAKLRALTSAQQSGDANAALDVAADLSQYPNYDGDVEAAVIWAIRALGGVVPTNVTLPAPIAARIALHGADAALARGDSSRAELLGKQAMTLAPDSTAAKEAAELLARSPTTPTQDRVKGRLRTLAISCLEAGTVDVVAAPSGLTVRGTPELAMCIQRHAAYYLGPEPFKAHVIVRPN